jgi:hypothetical protein
MPSHPWRAHQGHTTYLLLRDFRVGLVVEKERRSTTSCLGPNEVAILASPTLVMSKSNVISAWRSVPSSFSRK